MIVFNLICQECDFKFEGWFEDSLEFERQKKKHLIDCPSCNRSMIKKSLMAPNLSPKSNSKKIAHKKHSIASDIKKYKKLIEKNFDYVGDSFTEEAKKMKYGEINERPIYGEANLDETKELLEEEISVVPLPWTPSKKYN